MSIVSIEKAIFQAAILIADPQQRDEYLDVACQGDMELLARITELLSASDDENFMQHRAIDAVIDQPTQSASSSAKTGDVENTSQRVGDYKLLQQIGEGGFGTVYMAEQDSPVRRRVAVKIIKPGMDSKQVIARFEAERQALAMMDHPNIAKVFEAGSTDRGLPFFAMELVHGVPITEYCDANKLTTDERLDLFVGICGAIQHAHQKGVVHRDIKPSNIMITLIDDRPIPKVIDFGIAKATQQPLTDKTLFTAYAQLIGTPAYMSPEQAQFSGVDVDTRSDVYSLGVLLYELLVGTPPIDPGFLRKCGYEEVCRRIREDDPPTPSSRLSTLTGVQQATVAARRGSETSKLSQQLRGDLDWIVMKAVEKDRSRRYSTADALAEDIQRHLNREPVLAAPPSAWYILRKFAGRNGRLLATAGTIAAVLLLGTTISIWQAIVATKATEVAQAETNRAVAAEEDASNQRKRAMESEQAALASEQRAWQIAYASDMTGVHQALRLNNLGLARTLLDRNRGFADGKDLRNWEWRALWLRCQGDTARVFSDQVGFVASIATSSEGKWLAVARQPGGVRIQNALTGEVYHEFAGSPKFVAFAPKGNELYAVSYRGVLSSWSGPAFSQSRVKLQHGSHVRDVRISDDGTRLAMFGFDQQVSLWDLDSPDPRAKSTKLPAGSGDGIGETEGRIAISPDNKLLAIGLFRQTRILNLDTGDDLHVLPHGGKYALAFSPNGQYLAIGARVTDPTVYLYHVADGKLIAPLEGHADHIHDVEFSPNGRLLASASADHTIRVWDTETLKQVTVLRGHTAAVSCMEFTEGGEGLISASLNGEIYYWNPQRDPDGWPISAPSAVQTSEKARYSRASFSFDGEYLATQNPDDTVSLRSAKTLQVVRNLPELGTGNRGVRFSPVEPVLAAGDENGNLMMLELDRPENVQSFELVRGADVSPISFTRDGKRLLVLARDQAQNYCIIWSMSDRQETDRWVIPSEDVSVALSPDGGFVATEHEDRTTRIWSVTDPLDPIVRHHVSFGGGIAFSPDSKTLVAAGRTADLEILDSATFETISSLRGHMGPVNAVTFSPHGTRVATGCGGVKVWDVATCQELMSLSAEGYYFAHVEFSPDENAILAISGDGTLYLWRVPTFDEIQAAEAQQRDVAKN